MKLHACLIVAVALTSIASARAQIVPPSPSAADDRPDFSGRWALDPGISGDPAKANFEPAAPPRAQRPGGFGGGSSRRGRSGGFGGARPGAREQPARTGTPDARLQLLTDRLKKSSALLVISHHDPNFVISDGQDHTLFFQTDGSPEENHLGPVTLASTTHWDTSRVVTEYALGNRKLVYTYTLLASKQLVLRVRLESEERQRADTPELKLVYTPAPAEPK